MAMHRHLRPQTVMAVALFAFLYGGCASIGKMVAGLMTGKTSDLSVVSARVSYISNLYPRDANTVELDYFGDEWQAGKSAVAITFFKREGLGFYEIEGTVTVDGTPLPYIASGSYGLSGRPCCSPECGGSAQRGIFLSGPFQCRNRKPANASH